MDMEGLSPKDRRTRFQVNRVDSVAAGQHCFNGVGNGGDNIPTLLAFKEYQEDEADCGNEPSLVNGSPAKLNNAAGQQQQQHLLLSVLEGRERKSSMSDKSRGKKSPNNRNTTFDIPLVVEGGGGSNSEDSGRCDSPALLISPTQNGGNMASGGGYLSPTSLEGGGNQNTTGNNSTTYDTKYAKSFRHFTREALPRLDNYRNMMSIQAAYRPTLDELHNITIHDKPPSASAEAGADAPKGMVKFGWIKGVFVRCLLNIWGVMLFLRLSWCVGQAGIGQTWLIILLATAVTFITGISMSAISTNGQIKGAQGLLIILSTSVVTFITSLSMAAISTNGVVKGGGTYYMISRSLGPEFGASIGLIFAVANAVAVAMYVVGFAESLNDLLSSLGTYVVEDQMHSVRIVGTVAVICLTGIVVVGMEWEATAQVGLLMILLAAMADFVIGSFVGPLSDVEISKGFVGYNASLLMENMMPHYTTYKGEDQTFFSVFSIFFPAATGILAGANISGDLADPQASIPKGTLLAILVTTVSYIVFALIAGATVVRDATGFTNATDWNVTFRDCPDIMSGNVSEADRCKWGLQNSFQVMELVSYTGGLIYAGCFAATLSSALASLVSAPKVFQALCNDKLYPYLEVFGKGYGKNNEPVRGYVLTFVVALAFILIAELNAIAPLISNFFLAAYALVNFSTFHASLAKPVGWRPTFRYYNMWVSLVGCVLCVAVMFLISWVTALLTFAAIIFLYMVVIYRKPDVNWGSSTQAQTYKNALVSVQQLNHVDDHVKNYRPQILVLSGLPSCRPPLVDFAYMITKNLSLMVCGHIAKGGLNNRVRQGLALKANSWFAAEKIKAFYCLVDDMGFEEGAKALFQAYGVGKLRPNIVLMGYKNNWITCPPDELKEYFNTIHKALDMHLSVAVLRVEPGLDFSKKINFGEDTTASTSLLKPSDAQKGKYASSESLPRNQSFSQISQDLGKFLSVGIWNLTHASSGDLSQSAENMERSNMKPENGASSVESAKQSPVKVPAPMYTNLDGGMVPPDVMDSLKRFQKKYKHGTIDVWWLYDDGGLTLLLPYIINTRSNWSTCKLRVFALANKKDEFDAEQRSMAGLLAKFRIDYSDLKVITDINRKAQDSTKELFDRVTASFRKEGGEGEGLGIPESELQALKDKTNRHMRLRELLQENSRGSSMVVMTLPMPRKGVVSAPLYMAWLELLTKDMPPFLLVRGNQTSVLTFYS